MEPRRLIALAAACGACAAPDPPAPSPEPLPAPARPTATQASAGASAAEAPAACPTDMALVEGRFCPEAEQRCVRHHPEFLEDPDASERCLEFASPSRCVSSTRVLLRFCMDRYEWPNRRGERPQVLVDWTEARAACEGAGKRLCDEPEWLFACEGEEMLPYVNGYVRDASACVIDRPYVSRPRRLDRWSDCQASAECRSDFARLDQREPSGVSLSCTTAAGIFDLNGNVNEWVNVPGERAPRRSGLKGGWWGPVRNRCRPTVRFHDESDWGYEIGFRCCRDAKP